MAQGTQPLSDVFRNNVLFRLRGGQNVPRATYTRTSAAAYMAQSGVGAKAAASTLRVHWVDLDGDGFRETLTNLYEGARTQLVVDPENFGLWTLQGTVVRTGGQADPLGGTSAYLLDSNASGFDGAYEIVAYTADGTKANSIWMRQGTATQSKMLVYDATAAVQRHGVLVNWTAGVPSLATEIGTGTLFPVEPWTGGWYRLAISANSVVAANTNRMFVYPDYSGGLGTTYVFGANAWNVPFVSGYQGPSMGVAAADAYSIPINFGPQNTTVLARLARPAHADVSGTLGQNPRIFEIGTSAARLYGNFDSASRLLVGQIDTVTTDRSVTAAIPAGTSLTTTWQFKSLTTGGQVAIDVGSGLSAFSAAATAFTSFGAQTLRIGGSGGDELYGGLIDLLIVQGLVSRDRMMQIAGIT